MNTKGSGFSYSLVSLWVLTLWVASGILSALFFISSSWFFLRPYDVTATFCSFIHGAWTKLHAFCYLLLLVERVFCSFAWFIFWSHLTYPTLKKDFLTLKLTFFTLTQRDKLKWVCVTLNEGYLTSANNSSSNFYRFLIKI